MGRRMERALCLFLTLLALSGACVSCAADGDGTDVSATRAGTAAPGEAETRDEAREALEALGEVKWGGGEFGILCLEAFRTETEGQNEVVDATKGSAQVINDAVYLRNELLQERCDLQLSLVFKDDANMESCVRKETQSPTGEFQLIDWRLGSMAPLATAGLLSDLLGMGVDLDGPWWDTGTADFCLDGGVYFMNGSLNFNDDELTYVLIFNKEMQRTYAQAVPNPYETVRKGEWTLDYFRRIIQDVSSDSTGDGKWDEKDTYGFITTWEYGNTFFIGSDLRYILNDRQTAAPALYLDQSRMTRALDVLGLSRRIYHDEHATFMSPAGKEALGLTAFKEGRGLFYGEVATYLTGLNREMTGDYGVLPVPKYDKAQEFYRTWTHGAGSTFGVAASIPEDRREKVGDILETYAILSHQCVRPAYYDVMLTTRNVRDPESAAMLDLIFQHRVYEMAMYFEDFGFSQLFKNSVNQNDDRFNSAYIGAARRFDRTLTRILKNLTRNRP